MFILYSLLATLRELARVESLYFSLTLKLASTSHTLRLLIHLSRSLYSHTYTHYLLASYLSVSDSSRIRRDQTGRRCLLSATQSTLTYSVDQPQFLLCSYRLLLRSPFYLSFVCCCCPEEFLPHRRNLQRLSCLFGT